VGAKAAYAAWASANAQPARPELIVLGCDGSPAFGQRMVSSGALRATVIVPAVSVRAVEEIVSAVRGGRRPEAEIQVSVQSHPDVASLASAGAWARPR
jgi:hypothetical protein